MTDELRNQFEAMETPELIEILAARDLDTWRPEVFPLVESILKNRGVDVATATRARPRQLEEDSGALEVVATFSDRLRADVCRMAIESAGVPVWLSTENLAGIAPHLGSLLGVDVLVRPEDVAIAREVLAAQEAGATAIPEEIEPCPRCGSAGTEYGNAWRCTSCGYEWR